LRPIINPVATAPLAIIVMGVSGSGKSTLGAMIVARLGCAFLEGDRYHTAEAVAKMRSGQPLTDADRWPWLDRLGTAIGRAAQTHGVAVAACSALRRGYRDRLRLTIAVPTRFVLLDTDRACLLRRLADRPGHFMPPSLLDSQLATLELPAADEDALTLDGSALQSDLCADALSWLRVGGNA
jgi:gluconokinase